MPAPAQRLVHTASESRDAVLAVLSRLALGSELCKAALQGDAAAAAAAIAKGARAETSGYDGKRPLELAVARGDLAMAALLLSACADPSEAHWAGRTPLMLAALLGQDGMVALLLSSGRDPRGMGMAPKSVGILAHMDAGRGPLANDLTPLMCAAGEPFPPVPATISPSRAGKARCVAALLPLSDPSARDAQGRDALMHAVLADLPLCAALLAEPEAEPRRDADGKSARDLAREGSPACHALFEALDLRGALALPGARSAPLRV